MSTPDVMALVEWLKKRTLRHGGSEAGCGYDVPDTDCHEAASVLSSQSVLIARLEKDVWDWKRVAGEDACNALMSAISAMLASEAAARKGQYPAVWLRTLGSMDGYAIEVLIEVDDKLVRVISEGNHNAVSHIVESGGIDAALTPVDASKKGKQS